MERDEAGGDNVTLFVLVLGGFVLLVALGVAAFFFLGKDSGPRGAAPPATGRPAVAPFPTPPEGGEQVVRPAPGGGGAKGGEPD